MTPQEKREYERSCIVAGLVWAGWMLGWFVLRLL